jgi:hypothetical protein
MLVREIGDIIETTVDEAVEQKKTEWCPLAEIPARHCRMIDVCSYWGTKNPH